MNICTMVKPFIYLAVIAAINIIWFMTTNVIMYVHPAAALRERGIVNEKIIIHQQNM